MASCPRVHAFSGCTVTDMNENRQEQVAARIAFVVMVLAAFALGLGVSWLECHNETACIPLGTSIAVTVGSPAIGFLSYLLIDQAMAAFQVNANLE